MALIVLLIALAIERFSEVARTIRHWGWFTYVHDKCQAHFKGQLMALVFCGSLAFVTLLVLAIFSAFGLAWLWSLFVLLFCLGGLNFHRDVTRYLALCDEGSEKAGDVLSQQFYGDMPASLGLSEVLQWMLAEANHRLFAVIFWFALLGPVGAVLYRSVFMLNYFNQEQYSKWLKLMDWLPVRGFALGFGLMSHFSVVLPTFLKACKDGLANTYEVLFQCGEHVLSEALEDDAQNASTMVAHSMRLVNSSLIVWLVVLALIFVF